MNVLLLALLPVSLFAMEVTGAFARATAPGQTTGAVFLTLVNTGAATALTGASTPAAGRVELHTHQEDAQGVRRMRAIERIEVPATGSTVLVPGGHHLMLFNLTAPLTEGGTIALTLAFADQRTVTTTVPVRWAGATAADDAACCPH